MMIGFALVLLLLGAAGLVAVRRTRSIESNTSQVVREQLLFARLLNEVQAEQDTQTAVLHHLSRGYDSSDRPDLLRRLETTDSALERAIISARSIPEANLWVELGKKAVSFSTDARTLLESNIAVPESRLDHLFSTHDEVVDIAQQLLSSSSIRVGAAEASIKRESQQLANESSVLLGTSFALALILSSLTVLFSRWSIGQMEWQAMELNRVSWHMLQTQETAARRFSHELHDELGQSLAAVKANLLSVNPSEFGARRDDCIHLVDEAIANVRELSQLLRPVILDDFGLDAGLRWLTDKFAQRTGLKVNFNSSLHRRLDDEIETHLFRIAQEALTNIARHSAASSVNISLREAEDKIWLSIEDNGRGFQQKVVPGSSIGLTGMRARASQIGGELNISSPSSKGVRIEVWVPALEIRQDVNEENTHSLS